MPFRCNVRFEKKRKKVIQTRVDCVNKHVPYIYTTETDI